jgi:PAS domain S-box-containing protein
MVGPTDDETRAILQLLVECATVGIGFLDREQRFRYLNPTLALINGAPASALVGHPLAEVAPRAAPVIAEYHRQVLADGRPVMNVEYTRPGQAGDPARTWLADFFAVRAPDGTIIGVGVIVIEITERRLAQEARSRPAEATTTELQRVLRDAQAHTHRINNQLALAVGYGELLATRADLEGEAHDHLRQVVDALNAVGQTVASLQETVHRPDIIGREPQSGDPAGPA